MELTERLDSVGFDEDLSGLTDMKVSHAWLGYADALFLECGRLKKERHPRPRKDGTVLSSRTWLRGQVTFMLDCEWRVENRFSVAYGRHSTSRKLSHRMKKMRGDSISSVKASGRIPELSIELKSGQVIRTFQSFEGCPNWSIGFNDLSLIGIAPEWKMNEASVWLGFKNKAYRRFYCFDGKTFKPQKFLKEYGLQLSHPRI